MIMTKWISIALFITLFFQQITCTGQVEGSHSKKMKTCLENEEFEFAKALLDELELKIRKDLNIVSFYGFCEEFSNSKIEIDFYKVQKNSRLDSLIRVGLKTGFWEYYSHVFENEISPEKNWEEIPDDIEIIPPKGEERDKVYKSEPLFLSNNNGFISCLIKFAETKVLINAYKEIKRVGFIHSDIKANVLMEYTRKEDYHLNSIRFFFLIDCLTQRILAHNNYIELVKNK